MLHAFFIVIKVATVVIIASQCNAGILLTLFAGGLALVFDVLHLFHSRGLPVGFARKMFDKQYRCIQAQLAITHRRIQFLESENAHLLASMDDKLKNPSAVSTTHILRHVLEHATDLSDADKAIIEASLKQLILLENSSATMYRNR